MYLYLKHTNSSDFHVKLPEDFNYSGEIGLCEIAVEFNGDPVDFDLYCDLCDTSAVGSEYLHILRRIYPRKQKDHITYDHIYYLPVIETYYTYMRMYLTPVHNQSQSVDIKSLSCTLHLKQ